MSWKLINPETGNVIFTLPNLPDNLQSAPTERLLPEEKPQPIRAVVEHVFWSTIRAAIKNHHLEIQEV